MKKTIPFKKELTFKNNLAEITAISLDHELTCEGKIVKGNLVVSGNYKMNDVSINTEEFMYNIPVNIEISDKYNVSEMTIDIDDFYYEIVDNNILSVSIEIGLDHLKEELPKEEREAVETKEEVVAMKQEEMIVEKKEKVKEEMKIIQEELPRLEPSDVKSLFDSFEESSETYATYKICIVKETDTIESIMMQYGVSRDTLEQYNDLSDLRIGDKIIIPSARNEKN